MQILSIDNGVARCHANGIERDVDLFLLQDQRINVDDFVMVHVGYAIQKINPIDARSRWQLFDEMERSGNA